MIRGIRAHRRAKRTSEKLMSALDAWVEDWVELIMESQRSTSLDKPNMQVTGMCGDIYKTKADADCLADYLKKNHTASFVLVTNFLLPTLLSSEDWKEVLQDRRM